jgi:hypothetical protein
MSELWQRLLYSILSLTNIPEKDYENYGIYLTISGSAAIDCII